MALSNKSLKIAAVVAVVAAGSLAVSTPAFARGGGGHGGGGGDGGFGHGGFGHGGWGGRGFGYGGWGYGGWGPYWDYGYDPYYDDYYDYDYPVVVHRYHVVRDHYCRIVHKRIHTHYGWRWRHVRYCTR